MTIQTFEDKSIQILIKSGSLWTEWAHGKSSIVSCKLIKAPLGSN